MLSYTRMRSALVVTLVICLGAISPFYLLEKEAQLSASVEHVMSTPVNNFVWGAEQFRIDLARVRKEFSKYGDRYIAFEPVAARAASDILYSRYETLAFTINKPNHLLINDLMTSVSFRNLRSSYLKLDPLLAQFLSHPSPEGYRTTRDMLDVTSKRAAEFATETLHATQNHTAEARSLMLARAQDYKVSLALMMVGIILLVALIWFVNWKINISNKRLQKAVLNAEEAAQAKAQFLSSMSHEFRTPLNAISGYVQLILMKFSPQERADIASYENAVEESILNMVELVDQVLELDSSLHRNESVIVDHMDAKILVKNAIKLTARHTISKRVTIHQSFSAMSCDFETDSGLFTQIMTSLISNAVKYNHDEGDVWISCEHGEKRIRITIEDNGVGIPRDKEDLLFRPFERLGREAGAIGGSGTGLSLSKQICDRLGIQLGYMRSKTGGSVFTLDIPRRYIPQHLRMCPQPATRSKPTRVSVRDVQTA